MIRWLVVALAIGCAKPPPARPVTQLDLAAQANREGEEHMRARRFGPAATRFFEAASRTSEPLYFFNLCRAYHADGKLGEALGACEAAVSSAPNSVFAAEATSHLHRIKEDARQRGILLAKAEPEPPLPVDDDAPQLEPHPAVSGSSQAAVASRLNIEGTRAMKAKEFALASSKFREAVSRFPDPAYFFNLGLAFYLEGKFGDSLAACHATLNNQPSAQLEHKARQLITRVQVEAKRQGLDL